MGSVLGHVFKQSLRRSARLLPARIRQGIKTRLRTLLFPDGPALLPIQRQHAPPVAELGLNIVGYVRSEHGVGEALRSSARAATAAGLPFSLHDFNAGNQARTADASWQHRLADRPGHGVTLCHVNADQVPLLAASLDRDFFAGRYTIGYWAWELPEFPERWTGSFRLVDELWVLSQFTADAISRKSPVPVVRMPLCVDFTVNAAARRADFGLPEDRFLFLTMYDTQSFQERKNPEAVIAAFRRAFPHGGDVGLVVKINHTHSYPAKVQALKQSLAGVPGVIVLDRTLTRQQVFDLLALCDGFVSLHRAEGFGLGMAEAMFLGKPVVATHWSGNVDFMSVANSCPVGYELVQLAEDIGPYEKGQTWAAPDIEHAAWYLTRLVEDAHWRQQLGERGRATIHMHFSPAAVGRLYRQRLEVIHGLRSESVKP